MKNTILAFLATVGLAITACDNAGNKSTTGFVEAALMPYVESGQLAGAISVLYNDGVEEVACVGYSDLAAGRKITMDDVFMQCSQTKGFCGVTMAKLVEEGKVSLDDPVAKYLPEFRDRKSVV